MNGKVLVTGATGNVGRHVAEELRRRSCAFVAAGTSPGRIGAELGRETVALDFLQPATFPDALDGISAVFLLRPPAIGRVRSTLNVFIDECVRARIEHVTFLSVQGAERQRWVPHHSVERHLFQSGLCWTILRPGFFAQNLGDAYRADIRDRSELVVPAGHGKVAFVDVRDVAELAARSFVEPALRFQALTLTGPQAVTFDHVARVLSRHLGRTVRYRPVSTARYVRHLRRQRAPWGRALVQTLLHVGIRFGNAERVDPTLARLLERPARDIEAYVGDHRHLW